VIDASLDVEPACPEAPPILKPEARPLRIERRPFATISRQLWDALAAANPWATPFSAWAFQAAWWDAYGSNAHEGTLVALRGSDVVGIVPLMHRHQVEPGDAAAHTTLRHGHESPLTAVAPGAKTLFFGATYHADYATILAAPADLPDVVEALVDQLADARGVDADHPEPWDAVDLRRMRCGDPVADLLAGAFGRREIDAGWTLNVEREDVCPVVTVPADVDFDGFLATLPKNDRHEIRRKLRRAEAAGQLALDDSTDPLADLDAFVDLHQRRFGADGLFPPTPGGAQSRLLFRRLFELFGAAGPLRLAFLTLNDRRIAAGVHFETSDGYLYYNAGVDPAAKPLSPGVVMTALYVRRAIASGRLRLDFLRGDEPYKYEWGAVDEPVQRILVRRSPGGVPR
jgi:CelD/BcsL family acetyltransferase involved in cellulose biosynthesis